MSVATFESPVLSPGTRLVPARIGTWDRNQIAYIECPVWCTKIHTDAPSDFADIDHMGDPQGVLVPTFLSGDDDHYWSSRIEADPTSDDERMKNPHVIVGDETRFEARLTAEMADQLADDLVTFAAQIRNQARTARTVGDSARV